MQIILHRSNALGIGGRWHVVVVAAHHVARHWARCHVAEHDTAAWIDKIFRAEARIVHVECHHLEGGDAWRGWVGVGTKVMEIV